MTEQEWLEATDPRPMLAFLRRKASDRKLRLLAVACCRRVRHLLVAEACEALEVAEKVAEGFADSAERRRVREIAFHVNWISDLSTAHRRGPAKATVCDALARRAWEAASGTVWRTSHIGTLEAYRQCGGDWQAAKTQQDSLLAELLRCLFANPFRPITLNPAWLTWHNGLLVAMAKKIYDSRDFSDMPILADALDEAGCDNSDILGHCRLKTEHVRGCWILDLILGKS